MRYYVYRNLESNKYLAWTGEDTSDLFLAQLFIHTTSPIKDYQLTEVELHVK